jgi:Flp pilus assembly protein TadD
LGARVFIGGHPDSWIKEGEPRQGGDFGFDLSMWFEELEHITGRFSVQLKSGANSKFTSWDEPTISVDLTPEVCNIYLQDGNPVLLVFVALESEGSSENAEMYYLWIEEELATRLNGREAFDSSDPGKMRFHVPVSNKLTKKLDITGHLKEYWTYTRKANLLRGPQGHAALNIVSSLSPKGISALTSISPNTLERRLINEAMPEGSLWSIPNPGTTAARIKEISDYITRGNTSEADLLIAELRMVELVEPDEKAALSFQEGRRQLLEGNPAVALERFSKASQLQPDSAKFVAAELEAAVAVHIGSDAGIPADILAKAERFTNDSEVQFQLVRILALKGDYEKAESLLAKLKGSNKRKAQTLYHAIRQEWKEVVTCADEGLNEGGTAREKLFLEILRIRALLYFVVGEEGKIFVGGRPDLSIADAIALHRATLAALEAAQASGWPANSEMLLDCAAATSVICGSTAELLSLVADFAKKRPKLRYAQEVLARIATFMDEPDIAISALKRLDNTTISDFAKLTLLLGESGRHSDAVSLALEHLVDQEHELLVDMAVAMAAISAYHLAYSSEEAELRAYVSKGDPAAQSLLRFISNSIKHPEGVSSHLDQLWEDAFSGVGNETLQDNLFLYLRPNRDADVDRIIDLAHETKKRRSLTQMESAKFSAALLRRERFEDVVEFTNSAQELFLDDENIGLSRAIALDKLGQTSSAELSLRRFESSSRQDLLNARSQLLVRIGEAESAISLVQRALSTAKDHSDKFSNQRLLATLYSRIEPSRYMEAVWRLGEIARQEIESEEGSFLVHFAMAVFGRRFEVPAERIHEFQTRVQRFAERFPDSKIFQVGNISKGASAKDVLSHLRKLSGYTEEQARDEQRARMFGERSGSHIPFAFRPRRFAPYASNIVDLLKITINDCDKGESSRVIVDDSTHGPVEFSAAPILDLTTMLVLVELDLFEKLFAVWPTIAIPQVSLARLAELSFEPLNFGNVDFVDSVVAALRRFHTSIVQPAAPTGPPLDFPSVEANTIKAETDSGRFQYLTFDLASAAMLDLEGNATRRARTLWDFIQAAKHAQSMSGADSTLAKLRVASWNTVGVPLEASDVTAASLGAVDQTRDAVDDRAAARAVRKFITSEDLPRSVERAARVLADLAKSSRAQRTSAAEWFTRILYNEALLARSIGFRGTADEFTASLAALVVAYLNEDADAISAMEIIWRVLEKARETHGGHCDRENFYRLVGFNAAGLFDKLVKQHGIGAIHYETVVREILFSLATAGTHDREVLELAYYERTKALQA